MLLHHIHDTLSVLEETNVTEHVYLIPADSLSVELLEHEVDVLLGSADEAYACAGKSDLGGGTEHVNHVGVACLLALVKNVEQLGVVVDVVYVVSVVPENSEVLSCGLKSSKALNSLVGVGAAEGVGVLRNAPHTLDGLVLSNKLLYQVHVGAPFGKGDVDHFDAEELADGEVTVITGNRAKELNLVVLAPGLFGTEYALKHSSCHAVVHKGKRRRTNNDGLLGSNTHIFAEHSSCLGDTGKLTVVAAVNAALGNKAGLRIEYVEHGLCKCNLVCTGLAACHVELEALCLILCKSLFKLGLFGDQFFFVHLGVSSHFNTPPH